jgi:hypothetical protein
VGAAGRGANDGLGAQADVWWLKVSRPLIQVLVSNNNISGLTISLRRNEKRLVQER